MNQKCTFEHQHDLIQESVHDLEAAAFAIPRRSKVSLVPALPLQRHIFESHIADLEDLDRHAMVLIFSDGFQQSGKQRRAHDLILGGFGVRQAHRLRAVIMPIEIGEVFVVRA